MSEADTAGAGCSGLLNPALWGAAPSPPPPKTSHAALARRTLEQNAHPDSGLEGASPTAACTLPQAAQRDPTAPPPAQSASQGPSSTPAAFTFAYLSSGNCILVRFIFCM